jgi:hypothetical protein
VPAHPCSTLDPYVPHCDIACRTAGCDGGVARLTQQRGQGIPVASTRSPFQHMRFATGNAAMLVGRECPYRRGTCSHPHASVTLICDPFCVRMRCDAKPRNMSPAVPQDQTKIKRSMELKVYFLGAVRRRNVYLLPQRQNFSLERCPRPKQICDHPNNEPDKISHPATASPDSRSTASQIEFATGTGARADRRRPLPRRQQSRSRRSIGVITRKRASHCIGPVGRQPWLWSSAPATRHQPKMESNEQNQSQSVHDQA